jgi:DNA-binding CsgD family transcriptional regulator
MRQKKRSILFLMLFIVSASLYPQYILIDSLNQVLKSNTLSESERMKNMIELGKYYGEDRKNNDLEYNIKLVQSAKKLNEDKYIAQAYVNLTISYFNLDSISLTYTTMDTCQFYLNKITDEAIRADALLSLAKAKYLLNDTEEALQMALESLVLAKEIQNEKLEGEVYFFLSKYYRNQLENNRKYTDLLYKTANKNRNITQIVRSYRAKGVFYTRQFALSDRSNDAPLDSAAYFLKEGLNIYNKNVGRITSSDEIELLGNLASVYTYKVYFKGSEQYYVYPDSVAKYANLLLDIGKKTGDIDAHSGAYRFLAGVASNKKDFKEANRLLMMALDLMKDKPDSYNGQYVLAISLAHNNGMLGDYKEAFLWQVKAADYLTKYHNFSNSLNEKIAEAKYRVKENEHQLLLSQQREKDNKRLMIIGAIVAIVLIIFMIIFYQLRLRNSKQQQRILQKEKEEADLQARLQKEEAKAVEAEMQAVELEIELERERADRKAMEVNRLQKELIVGSTHLERKNEMLEIIRERLKNGSAALNDKEIQRLFADERKADDYFEDFTELLKNIHPDFFQKLQDSAQQKLTALDLKYCTYIYMNLTSKDIAALMFVEPKTVRMTKYRLKQKLKLEKEVDLTTFVRQIIDL